MSDDPFKPRHVKGGYFKPHPETVWPHPDRVGELSRKLIYGGDMTEGERMFLASVCSSYIHMLTYPLGVERVIVQLRRLRRALRLLPPETT